jgi:signal transduction histidine kinase
VTIWSLIPLVTCVAYIVLLVFTLQSLEKRINRLFSFYLCIAAIWSFISFMLHFNAFPNQALFWNNLLSVAIIWTLIAYYHFIRAFVNKPAGKLIYIGYASLVALSVLAFNGYIVQYAYVLNGVLYHSLGISLYFMAALSLIYIVPGVFHLIEKYRTSTDSVERNRTAYLIAGWSILMLFAYSNIIPALDGLPVDHIGSLANILIIAYAILKYQLLDIKLVMRKGLVYSSLTIFLTAMYLLSVILVQMFFNTQTGYSSLVIAIAFALIVALFFNPLRNALQKWIDRVFYRQTYDYRQTLLHFSDEVSNVLDLGELAQSILEPVVNTVHVKQAVLLFPETGSGNFKTRFSQQVNGDNMLARLQLKNDNPIVTWLETEGKALRKKNINILPQFKAMQEVEKLALNSLGVELLCPIRSKGKLVGILALGSKQSEAAYSDEELSLLMTMANEAGVVVENASMLDSLRAQQVQVEQLLAQVVQAQEEERNRISIDLHDSVAQWLVGASYRLQTFDQIFSEDKKARRELADMEDTVTRSLKELRRVVVGLRPPALDELGLTHALKQSLEDLKGDSLECKFRVEGTPVRLASTMEIAVYRMCQETLSNIRKHSQASKVNLFLQFQEDRLNLEIRDNGKGFDLYQTLNSAISAGHMGLLGMKKRAEMFGGDFNIKTSEGAGTTVIFSLPIKPLHDEN